MKYIFVAGAPGSKWSSVVKNIYYSSSIDRSDYSEQRTYYHDASGTLQLMHLGAYYDPGMEFGKEFDKLEEFSKEQCEHMFDQAFAEDSKGIRIIKSHVFAHKIDFLKEHWPDCAIVLVHRPDDACLGWWVKCGHFDITYPDYADYYKNLKEMSKQITLQNADILKAIADYQAEKIANNSLLCWKIKLVQPQHKYLQIYAQDDVEVYLV